MDDADDDRNSSNRLRQLQPEFPDDTGGRLQEGALAFYVLYQEAQVLGMKSLTARESSKGAGGVGVSTIGMAYGSRWTDDRAAEDTILAGS